MKFERDVAKARYRGRVILASTSERRRRLMAEAGYDFEAMSPGLAEDQLRARDPRVLAESLAYAKARVAADRLDRGLVIGADTVVALDGEILGKPVDEADARRILGRLSGSTHEVITGLCVLSARRGERLIGAGVTRVTLKRLTGKELDDYVASGEGLGKAGAYALQENGDKFVARLDGSFTNVVGLPMPMLADFLDVMKRLVYKE